MEIKNPKMEIARNQISKSRTLRSSVVGPLVLAAVVPFAIEVAKHQSTSKLVGGVTGTVVKQNRSAAKNSVAPHKFSPSAIAEG